MVAIPKESRGGKVDRCSNCTKTEQELADLKGLMTRLKMLLMEENPELLNAFENPAPLIKEE